MRRPSRDRQFRASYGPWALVAGASEGLGAAYARALADRGLNLVLLARREAALEAVAAPLRRQVEVRSVAQDLADDDLAARLTAITADLEIGLCVYNAALSQIGPFLGHTLADKAAILDVNCRGPLIAAHVLGEKMAARGRGGIVLMSSLTAFWGSPLVATYGASRAFNLSLGEALWYELGPRGVDVLVCCAGATRTPGLERVSGPKGPRAMEPEAVAEAALRALGRRSMIVPGLANRLAALLLTRLFPRRAAITIMGSQTARLAGARPAKADRSS